MAEGKVTGGLAEIFKLFKLCNMVESCVGMNIYLHQSTEDSTWCHGTGNPAHTKTIFW